MDEFKPGDVVVLRSGGPSMTVAAVDGPVASCQWFDGKEPKQKDFLMIVLEKS